MWKNMLKFENFRDKKNFVQIFKVKNMQFEHFWKCTPEMCPSPFQISKYATGDNYIQFSHWALSCYQHSGGGQ